MIRVKDSVPVNSYMENNHGFSSATSMFTEDISTFDPSEEFKEFDSHELYDREKEYPKELFKKNGLQYINVLYRIVDRDKKELEFVVAEERLSVEDVKKLGPYCRCEICRMYFFNPAKYLACAHCFGCLRTGSDNQYIINRTREYYQKRNNSWFGS